MFVTIKLPLQRGVTLHGETVVAKYTKDYETNFQSIKKEVVAAHKTRILKTVNQEIDIIQTNLDATKRMIARFELMDDLPNLYKQDMD